MQPGKSVAESRVTIWHRPLPEEANHAGNVYGGNIMRHMDAVGAIAAIRHARGRVVTAAVEYMSFRSPVRSDEIMIFHASVNAVWTSSMEVGIRTEAEHPYTGERRHVCTCYLTFVGLDEQGRPHPLPAVLPETEEDLRRMADATRRMALSRIEHKHEGTVMSALSLEIRPGSYAVCRLGADAPFPDLSLLPPSAFVNFSRTDEELSLVLEDEAARALARSCRELQGVYGHACLKVAEPRSLHSIGMLSGLTTLLASARVPVFNVSTYDACYLLLQEPLLEAAVERLKTAGHSVVSLRP